MSSEATTWAYKIDALTVDEKGEPVDTLRMGPKFALVALANFADEDHSAFPSFATLAARMSCSRSTAIEAVKKLEEVGLVVIRKRQRANNSHTSSRYYLPVDAWEPKLHPGPESGLPPAAVPVDNSADPSPESGPAQSGNRTPLNRQPNQGFLSSPVPYVTPEARDESSGTGPKPSPALVSPTWGQPLNPADVFAAVGSWLPSTFDDEQLTTLADEITAAARPARVFDPTGYVIRAIRNTIHTSERQRGKWLLRADEIAAEHIAIAERGARF
ncbi:MAG: hypothetical protein K0S37_2998 [Microbacterium sp.]|nr:hypothetical protein [Microbacterium sp.]